MSDSEYEREPNLKPFSAVLTYKIYGYPTSVDPFELRDIIAQIGLLIEQGLPGTSIHGIRFEKGELEVEVR